MTAMDDPAGYYIVDPDGRIVRPSSSLLSALRYCAGKNGACRVWDTAARRYVPAGGYDEPQQRLI